MNGLAYADRCAYEAAVWRMLTFGIAIHPKIYAPLDKLRG